MPTIKQLATEMAALSLKKGRRRKRKTAANKMVAAVVPGPVAQGSSKRRRKGRGSGSAAADGEMTLSRLELLGEIPTAGKTWKICPSTFGWLSTLCKPFERFVFESLVLEYRPLVGTNAAGAVTIGVSWGDAEVKDRAKIACLSPVVDHAVWTGSTMVLPARLLKSRPWFQVDASQHSDSYPGLVCAAYSTGVAATCGELWVRYKVRFQGTHS
uniref:Capsid protein n=1 Tax=Thrips tabaci associated luteo-like virus 1 TaxID=2767218 RepID=A0A7G9IR95_9LUTE|nr:putative CP [Thrips tabaci associated luteo-like virus 1]